MKKQSFKREEIVRDLKSLGLQKGDLVNVKASLKSIGFVEGGAKTLLDALIETVGEEGTVITESFVQMYQSKRTARKHIVTQETSSYAGALANEILKHPKSYRSSHPVQKFAAIGAKAEELMLRHNPESRPYAVLREMIFDKGKNIRIGGLDKVVGVGTTHVALDYLKIPQKREPLYVYYNDAGKLKEFKISWANGCKRVFNSLIPVFIERKAIIKEGKIGEAESLLTDMKSTYDIEIELLEKDLPKFHCDDPSCINCNMAWKHTRKRPLRTIWSLIKNKQFGHVYWALRMLFNTNYQPH